MGQHLDAPFRHDAGLDPGDGEGGRSRTCFGIDRPRHVHQRPHRKAVGRKPLVRLCRIGDRESNEVQPGMLIERRIELTGE